MRCSHARDQAEIAVVKPEPAEAAHGNRDHPGRHDQDAEQRLAGDRRVQKAGADQAEDQLQADGKRTSRRRSGRRSRQNCRRRTAFVVVEADIVLAAQGGVGEGKADRLDQGPGDDDGDKQDRRGDQGPGKAPVGKRPALHPLWRGSLGDTSVMRIPRLRPGCAALHGPRGRIVLVLRRYQKRLVTLPYIIPRLRKNCDQQSNIACFPRISGAI